MNKRHWLIISSIGAAVTSLVAGHAWFLPLLKLLFPAFERKISASSADELAVAAAAFGVALCFLGGLLPISALVTEKFSAQAKCWPALAKSALFGLLAFGASVLYLQESLASLDRVADKMPQLFGPNGPAPATLAGNPLTKVVWFTVICLVIFGPLDLWIESLQKQWRSKKQ